MTSAPIRDRIDLLNDLELETVYLRDLLHLIADHLNETYQDDIADRSKPDVRVATTLAFVARDRVDAAYERMNATYGIKETAL